MTIDVAIAVFTDGIGQAVVGKLNQLIEKEVLKVTHMVQAIQFQSAMQTLKQDLKGINLEGELRAFADGLKRIKTRKKQELEKIAKSEMNQYSRGYLAKLKREEKAANFLHATYGSNNAKQADVKLVAEYLRENRMDPEVLKRVEFPPSKFTEDWAKTMSTGIASQLAWNHMQHVPQEWLAPYYHHGDTWSPDGRKEESTWANVLTNNKAYKAWPRDKLKDNREQAQASIKGGVTKLPTIIGGSGVGWVCSEFEGDWKDLNPENVHLLRQRYNAELHNARRQVSMLYEDMYNGAVPEPGAPSMAATWMLARKWIGKSEEGTIEYDLHHSEAFHK
jgi:hypothetical protein